MNDVANTDPTYIKLQNACRHNLKKGEPGYEYWVESCNQLALYEKGIRGAVKIELDELIAEVRESLRSEKLGVFSAKNEDVTDSCMMCGVGVSDQ